VAVAKESVERDRWDAYLFTTRDALQRSRFAEVEWRCLDGSTYGLLFMDGRADERQSISRQTMVAVSD
jgi:hypothetical protein